MDYKMFSGSKSEFTLMLKKQHLQLPIYIEHFFWYVIGIFIAVTNQTKKFFPSMHNKQLFFHLSRGCDTANHNWDIVTRRCQNKDICCHHVLKLWKTGSQCWKCTASLKWWFCVKPCFISYFLKTENNKDPCTFRGIIQHKLAATTFLKNILQCLALAFSNLT